MKSKLNPQKEICKAMARNLYYKKEGDTGAANEKVRIWYIKYHDIVGQVNFIGESKPS